MPKVNSRSKGRRGEQEVARMLRDGLGIDVHRNWEAQAAGGGCDIEIPHYAIEVKNCANPTQGAIAKWWEQTVEQGKKAGDEPVLFFKIPRQSWRVVVLDTAAGALGHSDYDDTLTMSVPHFIKRARGSLSTWAMIESIPELDE